MVGRIVNLALLLLEVGQVVQLLPVTLLKIAKVRLTSHLSSQPVTTILAFSQIYIWVVLRTLRILGIAMVTLQLSG